MNARHAKVRRMKTRQYVEHETVDRKTCNTYKSIHYIIILLGKYGVVFTDYERTVKFSKYRVKSQ